MNTQAVTATRGYPALPTGKSHVINALQILIFSLPVIYIGIILAVFVHEVLGHGLTAFLLGGQFKSFSILLDGMGYASIDVVKLSNLKIVLILLSGAAYTTGFSILFLILSLAFWQKTFLSAAFLYLAFASLLDGVPYLFWDAIALGGVGDYSLIWMLNPNSTARIALIALCGSLMFFGIVFFNFLLFKYWGGWMAEVKPFPAKWKTVLCLILFSLQAAGWLSFDWNQLIPGIGVLPSAVAIVLTIIILTFLSIFYKFTDDRPSQDYGSHPKRAISLAWFFCIALAITIIIWFQNGVILQ
jgi:hypothetical protein